MQGLLTKERKGIDPAAAPFAKSVAETEEMGLREGASLVEVVIIQSYMFNTGISDLRLVKSHI